MNSSTGSSVQQVQRVTFELPVCGQLAAEPLKSDGIRQHVVPQEEYRILERRVRREILHRESANDERSPFSIHAADRGLRRNDTVEPGPVMR